MYYEERIIDGVLNYRMTPNGNFTPMSAKHLTTALIEARKEIEKTQSLIDKAKEMISDLEFRIKI